MPLSPMRPTTANKSKRCRNTSSNMPAMTTRRTAIGICWVSLVLAPWGCVEGWVAPKSTAQKTPKSTAPTSSNTLFYKTCGSDETFSRVAKPVLPGIHETVHEERQPRKDETEDPVSRAASIPWIGDEHDCTGDVFLPHWNWQLDFFRTHLTNLRFNPPGDASDEDLYCMDDGTKRVYTISLSSDEYRDIRMTYMDFPSCKTVRCLAYPSDERLPILGMGIMKFGKHQHMAVLDYQPLSTKEEDHDVNDAYTSELLRMRAENPTMSQPHTYRHFVTEERKYFTDFPLIGKFNDKEDPASPEQGTSAWMREMHRGQREFVETHVKLTQRHTEADPGTTDDDASVREVHSEFDTHVSKKEPAGPMLTATYGDEIAHRLVHRVIFPLSRN
ncbi:unnamed protein product [Pseudo-nitzschia multistriata]|uniref:Uncharacterized protein n=1 Tax=Pseudo-nitzschia multistriata TaxID=183589 RepID=A0A448YVN6_9STRA|nr:unnamed protein product [Pseudo-nitzschia multistriata]